ncbi:dTDP-4-dehydrorhamnose reductase [uncultured Jannaschia sp.]|uniref:dTDP-4-dehydrorhamnose reductase n=1 Tax=uncultured Jannaschia sp. TaxID=293347 RepID=UPI00260A763C|nr:dTDP-4-dehydrorhamnose reductase [uncultured Jannaschia sp.]
MTVLVFGRTGQVARELARASEDVTCLGRGEADLSVPGACAAAIERMAPRAVINAAAWTDVDGAETSEAEATRINGDAPGEMARACAAAGIPFVHISTDYVFDGSGQTPWAPGDPTGPSGAYGRSKLAGEDAVREAGGQFAILRTSWVVSAHGRNFVTTMLRLGAERDALNIVADQIGGPTPARDIAGTCLTLAGSLSAGGPSGTYHFAGAPDVSWAGFADAIFDAAGLDCVVTPIPSSDYPTPARRPLNSRLDCASLRDDHGIDRPDWRKGLAVILSDLRRG